MKNRKYLTLFFVFFLFIAFSTVGYADGLYTNDASVSAGDTFTVSYAVTNRVENVGAITLYIDYDETVMQATAISIKTPETRDGNNASVSGAAPSKDDSGSIVASWTEPYCAMVLDPEQELLTITFQLLAETEGSKITSDIIVKGINTEGSIGNDDMSALTGVSDPMLVISSKNGAKPSAVPDKTEQEEASASNVSEEESGTERNNQPAILAGCGVAVVAALGTAVIVKKKKTKE